MKINKAELQNALEAVRPGLANRETIEQSTSFAFYGDRVVTYNDEISISHPVKGMDVTGAIKAQTLYAFLNKVQKEEIDIEWGENQVLIKAGRSKAGITLEQEMRLPIEEEIGKIGKWYKVPKGFLEALKFCHPCCSKDMSRSVLACVHVEGKKVEASDSYQIAIYTLDEDMPTNGFLIPASSVRELIHYDIKDVAAGEAWVHFRTEQGTVFSTRILNNTFPDTSKHMKVTGEAFSFPDDTNQILERATVFSMKDTHVGGDFPVVTIGIKDKRMKIAAENEYGWFEEAARVKYDGAPVTFKIGVEFLTNMSGKLPSCIIGKNKIRFSGGKWEHVVAMLAETE